MHEFFVGIWSNQVLKAALFAWLTAQILKVLIHIGTYGKLDLTRLLGAGGMPSSHTAFVVALATNVGISSGWDSIVFAISAVFAGVVMHDAAGVRRATGQQAEVLNKIIIDIYNKEKFKPEKLKELIGHSPLEILAGSVIGIFFGLIIK